MDEGSVPEEQQVKLTVFAATGDVAHLRLRLVDQPQTIGQAIGVAN
jgi:predicted DNA-binding protein with PD1-like motif